MHKFNKGQQLPLINYKKAGRPPKNDPGIRHRGRETLLKTSSLHLTVKVDRNKADIKSKPILQILKRSILRARKQGLKVLHFTLEWDHVHLLIEADNNLELGKGMQAFGVTFAKGINKIKKNSGKVYKHRYHFRKINSGRELKRVMNYIFTNGEKHRTATSIDNVFNSLRAEIKFSLFTRNKVQLDPDLIRLLDKPKIYYNQIKFVT